MLTQSHFSPSHVAPQTLTPSRPAADASQFEMRLARNASEIEEAQRLRYRVFMQELGAQSNSARVEMDIDSFDADCDHLLVRDLESMQIVGCYRILRPEVAARRGGFYADSEFDLTRLNHLRPSTVEVGRACIHPDFRTGPVIMMLWSGIARYALENRYQQLIGCASVCLADGGLNADALAHKAEQDWFAPAEYRVFPRHPYAIRTAAAATVTVPPLIKGYLRLGAWIGGAPAWDPDFNTADFFVMLSLSRLPPRYAQRFMGA